MATADRILQLKLIADVNEANKSLKKTEGRLKGMGTAAKGWGKALTAGLVVGGLEKVATGMVDAWKGFKSGEKVAGQLKTTWDNLGLSGDDYARTLDNITKRTLALGTSDDEAIQVYNNLLTATGSVTQANEQLSLAQEVAAARGISLEAAQKLVTKAVNGGAGAMEKLGIKGKTADDRIKDLHKTFDGSADAAAKADPLGRAMNGISEAMETIAGIALGPIMQTLGDILADTVVPAVTDFAEAIGKDDLVAQILAVAGAIGVLVAVSVAHPVLALAAAITVLTLAAAVAIKEDWLGQYADALGEIQEKINTGEDVSPLERSLLFLNDLAMTGMTPFTDLFTSVRDAWGGAQEGINGDIGGWIKALAAIIRGGMNIVLAPFRMVWNLIKSGFNQLGIDIDRVIGDAINGIVSTVRGALNQIIRWWNTLDFRIPKFEVFIPQQGFDSPLGFVGWRDTWLGFKGTGDLVPNLPLIGGGGRMGDKGHHKGGLWDVPFDEYPAFLHRGEMVVPSDFAQNMRSGGGMGGDIIINVMVPVSADKAAIGQEIARTLEAYRRRGGRDPWA